MSDEASPGPGWRKSADGTWYPPRTHVDAVPVGDQPSLPTLPLPSKDIEREAALANRAPLPDLVHVQQSRGASPASQNAQPSGAGGNPVVVLVFLGFVTIVGLGLFLWVVGQALFVGAATPEIYERTSYAQFGCDDSKKSQSYEAMQLGETWVEGPSR